METEDDGPPKRTISDLPEEVLEYILSLLSPYRDIKSAMQVCRLWCRCVFSLARKLQADFVKAFVDGGLQWYQHPVEPGPTITERYSHSACYYSNSVYVFGGCTSTNTAFNDLWRFDLDNQQWIRPLATGSYPSPKACATMVSYKNRLLLFGGWSHPTPYPLHQAAKFFNELHIYTPSLNSWTQVLCPGPVVPPGKAGHAASIAGDNMVVFGGFHGHGTSCNDVWVLNLLEMVWYGKETTGVKPRPRYGHSQIVLNPTHLLVLGGCGGPNMVGDRVIVLSKTAHGQPCEKQPQVSATTSQRIWVPPPQKAAQDQRHSLRKNQRPKGESQTSRQHKRSPPETSESSSPEESSSDSEDFRRGRGQGHSRSSSCEGEPGCDTGMGLDSKHTVGARSGMPSVRPNAMKNRLRQLETLRRYEEKFRQLSSPAKSLEETNSSEKVVGSIQRANNPMLVHVLDISEAITEKRVRWLPFLRQEIDRAPEDRILYSLTEGRAELIIFGGLQTDMNTMSIQSNVKVCAPVVSSELHFLRAPRMLS